MATTYFQDSASSDLNKNTVTAPANSAKLLQTAAGSASSLTITLPSSGSALEHWFIAEPNDPSTDGGTGTRTYTFAVNVTTANMNLTCNVVAHRLNSSGTSQAASGSKVIDITTTGVKTDAGNAGWVSMNLGTFAAGDRFALRMVFSNSAMSSQSVIFEVGLANGNEEVVAPWTFAAVPKSLLVPIRHHLLRR